MMPSSPFLLCTCQHGAEAALKDEVAGVWPDSRFSYSRPGFVTFKLTSGEFHVNELPPLVFALRAAVSLEKITGDDTDALAAGLADQWRQGRFDHVHIFGRVHSNPHHEADGISADAAAEQAVRRAVVDLPAEALQAARPDKLVLDCVRVAEGEWWLGAHRAVDPATRWIGGVWSGETADELVSRAYLKMAEALDWSRLPLAAGDRVAEIGCSPGGASQLLLERGAQVLGVDPADVDPRVAAHPHFRHAKKRGADMRVRDLRDIRWLTVDINVAPEYTLTTVERIATHDAVPLRGIVMNLKLLDWKLAAQLPDYLHRVRDWGFDLVMARQLSHNRQEVCVVATRKSVFKRRRQRKVVVENRPPASE